MDGTPADFGELIFSLLISYIGALEFFFVLRHLCHFSGRHAACSEADAANLQELKEKLQQRLEDAREKEKRSGHAKIMQDGVAYKDGFRIDPDQAEIDRLKDKVNAKDAKDKRRAEIEAELARQRQIEKETREKLHEAETELARQRAKAEEEERNKQKQQEQQQELEEAENFRRLLEAEKQREVEQRRLEEKAKAKAESEKQARPEEEENQLKLLESERKRELDQRKLEEEIEAKEKRRSETEDGSGKFLEAELAKESSEKEIKLKEEEQERKQKEKQKKIEENARRFLEAEKEMVQLQQKILESTQQADQTPIVEELIVKRSHMRVDASIPTVKTQFGQGIKESFTLSSKPLLFPSVSDDASSNEPHSSKQSSFNTQPSEELTTGTEDDGSKTAIDLRIPQQERQEPDGEDTTQSVRYDEDYLRSLDGLKSRPLLREDGSGRRRAFKKRRSSGSSNSPRESRTSRDEELKMFTSLEDEELENARKGDDDFTPIKYTNEPNLKAKGHHHRRHKRSPAKDAKDAKDAKAAEDSLRTSLEMLGEEGTNPWGEVVPEHYKNTEFWRREKAMSIDEEEIELETSTRRAATHTDTVVGRPKFSAFEEADDQQNQEAASALQKQHSKDPAGEKESVETNVDEETSRNTDANFQSSADTEGNASPSGASGLASASASPRLRRSPRIDEMDQYEERWKEFELEKPMESVMKKNLSQTNAPKTPEIAVSSADEAASWRDEHGLMLKGLSDFYDFTASVNPSRSRSNSRNPSPASSKAGTPLPTNSGFSFIGGQQHKGSKTETGNCVDVETKNIPAFIQSFHDEPTDVDPVESPISVTITVQEIESEKGNVPPVFDENENENRETSSDMNQLIKSLRRDRQRSRSRSRSPLPTPDNIDRSLEIRRTKLIRQNDEFFENLSEKCSEGEECAIGNEGKNEERFEKPSSNQSNITQNIIPAIFVEDNETEEISQENNSERIEMNNLIESLRRDRQRSRSCSRSPLPTDLNREKSLENRRSKLISQSNEISESLHDKGSAKSEIKMTAASGLQPNEDRFSDKRRSRSRSPLPSGDNIKRSLETRRNKLIQQNKELFEKLVDDLIIESSPAITVDHSRVECSDDESSQNVSYLVASLRASRSRSRSKSPMRIPNVANLSAGISKRREKLIEQNDLLKEHLDRHALSTELTQTPQVIVEYVFEIEGSGEETPFERTYERNARSRTPSRSQSQSRSSSPNPNDFDFHLMLNLESSQNRTLAKDTEEMESILAEKQRLLDKEALQKLKTANEETELMTLTPPNIFGEESSGSSSGDEQNDTRFDLARKESLQEICYSPNTPDIDRAIRTRLSSGFKRSKYVGESTELGNEYEQLRREAATFRRSKSPSPSVELENCEKSQKAQKSVGIPRQTAAERRRLQDEILNELILNSSNRNDNEVSQHGATRKIERRSPDRSFSMEVKDTERIKSDLLNSGFKRSTYVGESTDNSELYENMRREMAEFRRSRSCSRSPTDERINEDLVGIEAIKREVQDRILDKLSIGPVSFQNFSRHLNADFLDDRRSSDSAVIHKPDKATKFHENNSSDFEMEPEEYHHYRRFSLNQEQQVEEYPDDDFMCISQIEVYSLDGTRTWIQKDYHSESGDNIELEDQEEDDGMEFVHDDDETEGSEDERQTVVEVDDDEIDTDICDFSERGPTDESHHEQSECEEADRAVDHYANRGAADWQSATDLDEKRTEEEGAVGGVVVDSDSFEIDQIYGEAIKNRKQSGILREYDSILLEMQDNFERKPENSSEPSDKERCAMGANTRSSERGGRKLSVSFVETVEITKNDADLRYLGDANLTARQSTRLRSRYGYAPQSKGDSTENVDVDIDVNYKPKREYNWRKNFRIDDVDDEDGNGNGNANIGVDVDIDEGEEGVGVDCSGEQKDNNGEDSKEYREEDMEDSRKFSLGGESITLYSRSPDRDSLELMQEEEHFLYEETKKSIPVDVDPGAGEFKEKQKKKKNKKKSHRESKESLEKRYKDDYDDEDDSDSQMYNRRRQLETESPKKKSRSRRSSVDSNGVFSSRSSIVSGESIVDGSSLVADLSEQPAKKKVKKRKKTKDVFSTTKNITEERGVVMIAQEQSMDSLPSNLDERCAKQPAHANSTHVVGEMISEVNNDSIVTPITITTTPRTVTTITTTTTTSLASIDSFDILKDANFYPLF